jgi:hypothetical protein
MSDDKEEKLPRDFGLGGGDIGVILVALIFFLGTLYLFIGPSPFAPLIEQWNRKPPPPTEVTVGLPEAKPLPQQQEQP